MLAKTKRTGESSNAIAESGQGRVDRRQLLGMLALNVRVGVPFFGSGQIDQIQFGAPDRDFTCGTVRTRDARFDLYRTKTPDTILYLSM